MPNGPQGPGEVASDNEESFVRELIRKLVGEIAPSGSPEVQSGQVLREELGFDSVREVEIAFLLEELFGFESFTVEDAPDMETVGDLENFTLDMIAQGRAKAPTRSEIDQAESLASRSVDPGIQGP
jgi:acyl carrier protein